MANKTTSIYQNSIDDKECITWPRKSLIHAIIGVTLLGLGATILKFSTYVFLCSLFGSWVYTQCTLKSLISVISMKYLFNV